MDSPETNLRAPVLPGMQGPLLLFDGVCNLCNGLVRFIIPRDTAGIFKFAALQSRTGRQVLEAAGLPTAELGTLILVEDGRIYTKSTAGLRGARLLPWPWKAGAVLLAVPRPLRDWIYGIVARNRYRWFGRREACLAPSPELRARFLE